MAKHMETYRNCRNHTKSELGAVASPTTERENHSSRSIRTALLQESVVKWFLLNRRVFPWRDADNPFHVLVAEVLLRQTQARRVIDPYHELIARYPDVETLAAANIGELRAWFKPLGLVTRANNLIKAAKIILQDYGGSIPSDLEALLALPGIGLYSARAILCLGFNKRVPMIDESSGRLLRRILDMPLRGPAYCDQRLLKRAAKLIPGQQAKAFNFGLLDIAAKYCGPFRPICMECPLRSCCSYAHKLES